MTAPMQTVLKNIMVSTYSAEAGMKRVGDYLDTEEQAIERFAWFPTWMSSGRTVWLRKYIELRHHVQWRHSPRLVQGYVANRFTTQEYLIYTLRQHQGIYTDITEKQ